MARDKTYVDLMDEIRGEIGSVKSNPSSRKTVETALAEISTKYGIGAAHKAYDSLKLSSLGFNKPV